MQKRWLAIAAVGVIAIGVGTHFARTIASSKPPKEGESQPAS